jgi:preprotein translocase subunit SecY
MKQNDKEDMRKSNIFVHILAITVIIIGSLIVSYGFTINSGDIEKNGFGIASIGLGMLFGYMITRHHDNKHKKDE